MKSKKILTVLLTFILVLTCVLASSFVASADLVVIETSGENEALEYINLGSTGGITGDGNTVWPTKGELTQADGKYTITNNGFAQWYDLDGLGFAYKKIYFNYGNKAYLSFEGTLNSFDGKNANAGAGILIRSGLNNDASTVMLHIRPAEVVTTYRAKTGAMSTLGKSTNLGSTEISAGYPYHFKIELKKTTVYCYYKTANSKNWISYGSVPMMKDSDNIYVGFCQYSQEESYTATATFSNFSYEIYAPEGTVPGAPEEDGDTSGVPSEPTITLPSDPNAASDVLLRETFTDGSMTEGDKKATNPVWDIEGSSYEILTDDSYTNRWLSLEYADKLTAFFAGDRKWTDYTFKADITFTTTSLNTEKNAVHFYVRHTDYDQYGYENYTVSLINGDTLRLSQRTGTKQYYGVGDVALAETQLKYIEFDKVTGNLVSDQKHTIEITAFDNIITVKWDGAEVLSYTDNGDDVKSGLNSDGSGYEVKTTGCIGFNAEGACINLDNIFVYKLNDPLGGDYDNEIGGSWDKARPDEFLSQFSKLPY